MIRIEELLKHGFISFVAFFTGSVLGFVLSWAEFRWCIHKATAHKENNGLQPQWSVRRAILIALVLAIVCALLVHDYHGGIPTFAYMLLAGLLCFALLTDLDTFTIPNPLILAIICTWLISVWFMMPSTSVYGIGYYFVPYFGESFVSVLLDGLLGAVVVGGGLFVFSAVYEQVSKRPSLGGGDIKLILVVSLFLGLAGSVLNLFVSCIFGLIFAPLWRRFGRFTAESNQVKTFPFGPAIVMATLLSLTVMPFLL